MISYLTSVAIEKAKISLAFCYRSRRIAVSYPFNKCCLYEYNEAALIDVVGTVRAQHLYSNLAVHPNDELLAAAYAPLQGSSGHITFFELEQRNSGLDINLIERNAPSGGWFQAVGFTPDSQWLIASAGWGMAIYDLKEQKLLFDTDPPVVTGAEEPWYWLNGCNGVVVHPNNQVILSTYIGDSFGYAELFDIAPDRKNVIWREEQEIKSNGYFVNPAMFSADGKYFAVSDSTVKIYSFEDGDLRHSLSLPEHDARCVSDHSWVGKPWCSGQDDAWSKAVFTPDSQSVIAVSPFGLLCRWDIRNGQLLKTMQLPNETKGHRQVAISPFDGTLAVADGSETITFWLTS